MIDDLTRLRHMRDAAREAMSFSQGRSRGDLDSDRMLALALVQCIEIIGEAAARVTSPTRAALSSIPWQAIVGMRNHLIHAYFDVDADLVWETVTNDLPALLQMLEQALPADPA